MLSFSKKIFCSPSTTTVNIVSMAFVSIIAWLSLENYLASSDAFSVPSRTTGVGRGWSVPLESRPNFFSRLGSQCIIDMDSTDMY